MDTAVAPELRVALEAELALATEPLRAARLHFELGRIAEDAASALVHYQKAHGLQSDCVAAIRAARKLQLDGNNVQAALGLFDAELKLVSDPVLAARLHFEKGRVIEAHAAGGTGARERDAARKCYARAVELDATNPTFLKALETCERDAADWQALERSRELEANAVTRDPRHRAALLAERGRLADGRLGNAKSATELYQMALAIDDQAGGVSQALKRLLHAQGRWRELIAVLEREASRTNDPDVKAMAWFRVARVHAEQLSNQEEAIAALDKALEAVPSEPLVLEELAKLYESANDARGLAVVLGRLAESITAAVERTGLLCRIGELAEAHGDAEAAMRWHEAALAAEPSFQPALRALDRLYRGAEQWHALVAMHLAESEAVSDSTRKAHAHALVAEIMEVNLRQPDEAARHHARALSLQPGIEGSFKSLVRLHAQAGRHHELVELYQRATDTAKDRDVIVAYWFKIGALFEDALREPGQAIGAYRRILALEAHNLGAIHALQRASEAAKRHDQLAEALELEASLTKAEPRRVSLLTRAGEALEMGVGDAEAAVGRYKRVLEIDAKHAPALAGLGRVYQGLGKHRELLDVYERESELAPTQTARVALLHKIGELCETRLGDAAQAIARYRRALALDPRHTQSRRALERLLRARGDFRAVAEVLEAELPLLEDGPALARASYRQGEVLEMRLEDLDKAAASYQRALDAVPHYRPAADGLERVLAAQGAWSRLAEHLARAAAASRDAELAEDALLRAAEIWSDRLGDAKHAIASYEAVLAQSAENVAALLGLEPLYRQTQAWEELARVYAMQARVLVELPARIAALLELARLMKAHGLGNEGDLRRSYEAILSYDPQDQQALSALEDMALGAGDQELLARVDAAYAKSTDDPMLAAAHYARLGRSLEERTPAAALAAYRSALERDAQCLTAIRGLARAAELAGDAATLVEALGREAGFTHNGRAAAELLCRSARLRLEQLADRQGSVHDAEEALLRWPDSVEAARWLGDLLVPSQQIEHLVERLSLAAAGARDRDRQTALWREVARLQADLRDNVPAAIAALERVLDLRADDGDAGRALAALYGRSAQWEQAATVLERVVGLSPSGAAVTEPRFELARIYAQNLQSPDKALPHLHALLKASPGHRAALVMLLELELAAGHRDEALAVAQRLVQMSQDPRELAWGMLQVGRIALAGGDRKKAREALRTAVSLEGPAGAAAEELRKLADDAEGWQTHVDALREHIRRVEARELADDDLASSYLEIARAQHGQLGRAEEAFNTLRAGLAACGEAPALRLELAERLGRVGRLAEGVAELQHMLVVDPTVAAGWRGLVRAYQEQGRPGEASHAAGPLVALGVASDAERQLAQQLPQRVRPAMARPGSFAARELAAITAPGGADEARVGTMLSALGEGLAKAYAFEPESYGVTTRDRLPDRTEHPLRAVCDRLAAVFAVDRYDVYVHRSPGGDVRLELGTAPALFVPSYLLDRSEAQLAFALGRAFAAITRGMHPAMRLSRGEIACIVTGAVRLAASDFAPGHYDDEHARSLQKRVIKALSRRARKAVEDLALGYEKPTIDLESVLASSELTNSRAAALCAGDLPAAVELLRQLGPSPVGTDGARLVKSSPVVADLLRFWGSDAALDLRRRAGAL